MGGGGVCCSRSVVRALSDATEKAPALLNREATQHWLPLPRAVDPGTHLPEPRCKQIHCEAG